MWALEMEFCREFPAYKLHDLAGEVSALMWQRWLVDRASRRMAEDKDNLDDWGDDIEETTSATAEPALDIKQGETEEEAQIRRFIQSGKSGRR
jgi:hypothetical protein